MHSVKKGNQWYFGMKIHMGTDAYSWNVHTVTATSANVHDVREVHELIMPDDEVVNGDSGYLWLEKQPEVSGDKHLSQVEQRLNTKPTLLRTSKSYQGIN